MSFGDLISVINRQVLLLDEPNSNYLYLKKHRNEGHHFDCHGLDISQKFVVWVFIVLFLNVRKEILWLQFGAIILCCQMGFQKVHSFKSSIYHLSIGKSCDSTMNTKIDCSAKVWKMLSLNVTAIKKRKRKKYFLLPCRKTAPHFVHHNIVIVDPGCNL